MRIASVKIIEINMDAEFVESLRQEESAIL
jgi:hypothetical protein